MMSEKELVPKRRFEEFNDDGAWEQRELGEVAKKIGSGKTPRGGSSVYTQSGIPLLRSQNINNDRVNFQEVVYITEFMDEEMSNSRVEKNDVLLNITGASIGRSAVYELVQSANVNQHVCIIRPNQEINPYFIQLNLTSAKGQKQIDNNQAGGAREGLNFQQIGRMGFAYPKHNEQRKVGSFFNHLDGAIALQQKKIEKTKALRSAYLAEMFPAEGERVPKRRFAGFTEEWKIQKLEDIADIIGGGTPSTNNYKYWNGEIDWYTPTEIGNHVYAKKSLRTITKLGLEKSSAKLLPPNKTILFTSRAGIGNMAILKKQGTTNQGFQSIVVKEDVDTYFIYSMGHIIKRYAVTNASGSTFLEISSRLLGNMTVLLPCAKEQQKVGNFFKKLDESIVNHQQKLTKLKATKQAYLNEMFV